MTTAFPVAAPATIGAPSYISLRQCWAQALDHQCPHTVSDDPDSLGLCANHHEQYREER